MPGGRSKGPLVPITKELGAEFLDLYTKGDDPAEISKYVREVHKLRISEHRIKRWIQKQLQARSVASMRVVGPKVELVMGDEIDKLLRFRDFCETQFLEIWRNLPRDEKYSAKTMYKFMDALQKTQAQIFMVHGLGVVAKAGTSMDELTRNWNEKLDRLVNATKDVTITDAEFTPDEDTQPNRDE